MLCSVALRGAIKSVLYDKLTKHSISQQIKESLFKIFHRKICQKAVPGHQIGKLGQFTSALVANVDQTPLPFNFTNRPTYETKGAKTVWVQGGSSG